MPDARLHFRSPAWQSLPVAGLPPATSPESAQPTPAFFRLHRSHRLGVGEAYEGPARRLPAAERQSRRLSGDRQVTAGGRAKARRLRTGRGETHPRVPAAGWPRHPHCRPDLAGRDCRRRSDIGGLLPFEPCDSLTCRDAATSHFRRSQPGFTAIHATQPQGSPWQQPARISPSSL